jgi:hypothetical protein
MLGWFAGRVLLKNASSDLRLLRDTVRMEVQVHMARTLAGRMALVESMGHKRGAPSAVRAAEDMLKSAQKDRHLEVARATGEYTPAWLLAALSETWASARSNSIRGRISMKTFKKIDGEIGHFLIDALGPEEIKAIIADYRSR